MEYNWNLDVRQGLLYMFGTALTMYDEGVFSADDLRDAIGPVYTGLMQILQMDSSAEE